MNYGIDSSIDLSFDPVTTVAKDSSPASIAIYEAVKERGKPERLNPAFLPTPFDRDKYLANPAEYLEIHEPGRVFQPAQPGPGVPVLERVGRVNHLLRRGESVRLSVKTEPHMPATFTSFDLGAFDNGLATISVAADESGLASTAFHAAPGKKGEINILVASPAATEKVAFQVFVVYE